MPTLIFRLLACLILTIPLSAQEISWVKTFHSIDGSSRAEGIFSNESGGVYAAGLFDGSVDFDPNDEELILTSLGSNDIYIVHLDAEGNLIWHGHVASSSNTSVGELSLVDDQMFLSGTTSDDVEIRLPDTTIVSSTPESSMFLMKLDTLGNPVWMYRPDGPGASIATTSLYHTDTSFYIAANFTNQVDFGPDTAVVLATSNGATDVALIKLNGDGEFLWMRHFGSTGIDQSWSIDTDSAGVYLNMTYFAALDADPGVAEAILPHDPTPGFDAAVIKLNHDGDFLWVKAFETASSDFSSTDVQPEDELLISGGGIIAVYSTQGEFIDTFRYLPGGFPRVDITGLPVKAGSFRGGEIDFDPSAAELIVSSGTSVVNGDFTADIYAARYNPDFSLEWLVTVSSQEQLLSRGSSFRTPGATYLYSEHFDDMVISINAVPADTILGDGDNDAFIVKFVESSTTSVSALNFRPLSIWPQPARDHLFVEIPSDAADHEIEIFSLDGKRQLIGNVHNGSIGIQNLTAGSYLVRVKGKKSIYQSLFIKSD